ncbi:MAG: hypothetical protein NTW55_00870 [Planctomycetota bacterium]|nr:hypothetical protein [Planctomycetota bacterium]
MEQWEINKPLGQCFGSGRKIEYGEEYFAALVETGQGLQRQDYSREFWDSNKPSVYCYWKSKLPSPDQKKHIFIDDEMLMAFFERLSQETEQEKINFRFVLALILMRKRRLKYDSSRTDGDNEIWHLRVIGEDRFVDVANPHLDEKQIGQLSSQISLILQVNI